MERKLYAFMRRIGIAVSRRHLYRMVASHADYPSLLSIADSLERLGLRYGIQRIEREDISDVSVPCLLPLEVNGGDLLEIYSLEDLKRKQSDIAYWNGIVINIEQDVRPSDSQNHRLFVAEKSVKVLLWTMVLSVALMLLWFVASSLSLFGFGWALSASVGVVIGYFLFAKEVGVKYRLVENFCNIGVRSNCDDVLQSDGAVVFGEIKLSYLSFSYFVFHLLLSAIFCSLPNYGFSVFVVGAGMTILAIPVVIYSLFCQAFRLKAWCRLCLAVAGTCVLMSALFAGHYALNRVEPVRYDGVTISILGALYLIVTAAVVLLGRTVRDANDDFQAAREAERIKNNPHIYNFLLHQQRKVDSSFLADELRIGSPGADVEIVMASNLHCRPCRDQHRVASELVALFPDRVSVAFRFLRSGKGEDAEIGANEYLIQYWIENIIDEEDRYRRTDEMLHEWYSQMNLSSFAATHPLKAAIGDATRAIEEFHYSWAEAAKIRRTPTFFVNGYELPHVYKLEDLKSMVPGLEELFRHAKGNKLVVGN